MYLLVGAPAELDALEVLLDEQDELEVLLDELDVLLHHELCLPSKEPRSPLDELEVLPDKLNVLIDEPDEEL